MAHTSGRTPEADYRFGGDHRRRARPTGDRGGSRAADDPFAAGNAALARVLLQRQPDDDVGPSFARDLKAARSGGTRLPQEAATRLEPHIGSAVDAIRVHSDDRAQVLARRVNAVAFTSGRDIFFGAGAYQPHTQAGLQLLAHEGTHVAQQAAGPVSGVAMGGGVSVSDPGDRFEREAARVASEFGTRG